MTEEKIKAPKKTTAKSTSTKVKSSSQESVEITTPKVIKTQKVSKPKETKSTDIHAVGKRKTSIAKVWLNSNGSGKITVNNQSFEEFFGPRPLYKAKILIPFKAALLDISKFDINIVAEGGGKTGFIDASQLAISRSIIMFNPSCAKDLRDAKLLTRDNRVVESKKYGKRKARKKEQYSKR